jgi:hypothetical protein
MNHQEEEQNKYQHEKHSRIYCIIKSNKRKWRAMSPIVKHIQVAYQER